MEMIKVWIVSVIFLGSITMAGAAISCENSTKAYKDVKGIVIPELKFNPEYEVIRFGKPTAFVTTTSVGTHPFSLMDPFRQSNLYHEYILIGPGIVLDATEYEGEYAEDKMEEIQLIIYDQESIQELHIQEELFQQNLGKRYMWRLINGTGMLPSMTIQNTTFQKTIPFHTKENDKVAYHMEYARTQSRKTIPPLDVIIEFPAKTRMFQTQKTLIDYQSVGLLRWKLSTRAPLTWADITKEVDFVIQTEDPVSTLDPKQTGCSLPQHSVDAMYEPRYIQCLLKKRFRSAVIPCIKDITVWFKIFASTRNDSDQDSYFRPNRLLLRVPLVDRLLTYQGWLDLTEVYCPYPEETDECGSPQDLVVTNEHILILTNKAIWVSSPLSNSSVNVSYPYALKPLIKFTPVDACNGFDYINCTESYSPVLIQQTIIRRRLFYTPVCYLYQDNFLSSGGPEDMVMLVIEHVTVSDDLKSERDAVTVLYARAPYQEWKMLFYKKTDFYDNKKKIVPIISLISIFYNHHKHHFDITLELDQHQDDEQYDHSSVRFVLPKPLDEWNGRGHPGNLSGLLSDGFVEFYFPVSMQVTHQFVSTETLDLFFTGNQIWIAEAAGPFMYLSLRSVDDENGNPSTVTHCSFNHPDRTYVCAEKMNSVLYVGRIGVNYTPTSIKLTEIAEVKAVTIHNLWPESYQRYVMMLAHFMAGYSGKIMMWYFHDAKDLSSAQQSYVKFVTSGNATDDCFVSNTPSKPVPPDSGIFATRCIMCSKIMQQVQKHGCNVKVDFSDNSEPIFMMLSMDPKHFKGVSAPLDGPLLAFPKDGNAVLLFEATIPRLKGYDPLYEYLAKTSVGSNIGCVDHKSPSKYTNVYHKGDQNNAWDVKCPPLFPENANLPCDGYIRHLKSFEGVSKQRDYLPGLRSVFLLSLVGHSFPLTPIPADFVVIVLASTNYVIIQLDTGLYEDKYHYQFKYEDVGKTLYMPQHFSALLKGFPKYKAQFPGKIYHDMTRMVGISNRIYRMGARIKVKAFSAYLIDFSTPKYCEWYRRSLRLAAFENATTALPDPLDTIALEYKNILAEETQERDEEYKKLLEVQTSLTTNGLNFAYNLDKPRDFAEVIEDLLVYGNSSVPEAKNQFRVAETPIEEDTTTPTWFYSDEGGKVCQNISWTLREGRCHLRLVLTKNPVIRQSGGRISLDKYDAFSFQIKLTAITSLGKGLINRPLITITNTNPRVLQVEQSQVKRQVQQIVNITISPTGIASGVSTLTVRPIIVSNQCNFAEGSFTLIVQIRLARWRRLHVNYPVSICKAPDEQEYRPWKVDLPNCVPRESLLNGQDKVGESGGTDKNTKTMFYTRLPENYRPPTTAKGTQIPTSQNLYNYKDVPRRKEYKISHTLVMKCGGKRGKHRCVCNDTEKLDDHELFTECREMVYTVTRGEAVHISMDFDRLMRDEDQYQFFIPKTNWSVLVTEVNGRSDYSISNDTTPYIIAVRDWQKAQRGHHLHDMKKMKFTLHGTGLFHFKVELGEFESFGEVSGYFMLYTNEWDSLNHVFVVVLMLSAIFLCTLFVFCGFLIVRKRLSTKLPHQARHADKPKLE